MKYTIFLSFVLYSMIMKTRLVVDRDKPVNSVMMDWVWTQGYYLDQSLPIRLFRSVFDNVLYPTTPFSSIHYPPVLWTPSWQSKVLETSS